MMRCFKGAEEWRIGRGGVVRVVRGVVSREEREGESSHMTRREYRGIWIGGPLLTLSELENNVHCHSLTLSKKYYTNNIYIGEQRC